MITSEKIEDALELALVTLSRVASEGDNAEKILAAKELGLIVDRSMTQMRKAQLASLTFPLISAISKNMAGQLSEQDPFCPAYSLQPAEQGSVLLALAGKIN